MLEAVNRNKIKSGFIVAFVIAFLFAVFYFIGYYTNLGFYAIPLAVCISIATSFGSYYYSDKIILRISRAHEADPVTERRVRDAMEGLCLAAGLPMPKVYIMEDSVPNAFATGRNPQHAVVCVTTGLLERLDYYELEGVLAHELAHIKNYDILLSTIVTVMVGMIVIISDYFSRALFWGYGRKQRENNSNNTGQLIIFLIGLVFIVLSPIFGQLMKLALSRRREYLADATAVEFTRNPQGLIGALTKLDASQGQGVKSATNATENLYIVSPLRAKDGSKKSALFSTHPPIEARIAALQKIR